MSIGERRRESVVAKRSSLSGFLNQYCVKGLLAALVEGVEENTLVVTVKCDMLLFHKTPCRRF